MTLNSYFALKSLSGSATNGLVSPAFGQNCSKICRATHILSAKKCSPGNVVSGGIRHSCNKRFFYFSIKNALLTFIIFPAFFFILKKR